MPLGDHDQLDLLENLTALWFTFVFQQGCRRRLARRTAIERRPTGCRRRADRVR
jgi:hypothetical protein